MYIKTNYKYINCEVCGDAFKPQSNNDTKCEKHRTNGEYVKAYSSSVKHRFVGVCSELNVCVDLMKRGLEVFKSISQHSSFDIIAYSESDIFIRIEVTTGCVYKSNGARSYQKHMRYLYKRDIIAVQYHDSIIYYDNSGKEIDLDMYIRGLK